MRKEELPAVEAVSDAMGGEIATHPAFGVVCVTKWSSSGQVRLFGSDLGHKCGITLKFSKAEHRRSLSNDWHLAKEFLLEVDLSESQWARMVASVGNGSGVPVTISYYRDGEGKEAPQIAEPKATKREVHGDEMAAMLRRRLSDAESAVTSLRTLIDSGKIGKRDLSAIYENLQRAVTSIPGSVQFVYDQFAEATEKVAEDAKTEVEAHINGLATRLGFEALKDMAPLLSGPSTEAR